MSSSFSNSRSSIFMMLVLPLPQSPNTPIVTGKRDLSDTTSRSSSAWTRKPIKSSTVSLSDHMGMVSPFSEAVNDREPVLESEAENGGYWTRQETDFITAQINV